MSAGDRVHRVPSGAKQRAEHPSPRIDGLVARPGELAPADLIGLPRFDLRETFSCDEARAALGQVWRGVRVVDVVALARPLAGARFVRVCAGGFAIPLALEEAGGALLAETLNGAPLSLERGAPWRLVVPGGRCFTSVKWVTRMELAAEPDRDSGGLIERARRRRDAAAAT